MKDISFGNVLFLPLGLLQPMGFMRFLIDFEQSATIFLHITELAPIDLTTV
jgi:hypothetical protein